MTALYRQFLPVAVSSATLLSLWYGVRYVLLSGNADLLLPLPHEIFAALWTERAVLWPAAGQTLLAATLGLGLAVALGSMMAMLFAMQKSLRTALYPWVHVLQMTPIIVLIPFLVLWLDAGLPSVVAVTFLISVFPIVASMTQGLLSTPERHLDLYRIYHASHRQTLLGCRLPFALPYCFSGLKIAATLAVIGAITGEFFAGSSRGASGLGFLIINYRAQFKLDALGGAAVLACLLGIGFSAGVAYLRWRVLRHWHESIEKAD